jgi:hypothetical protein
MMRLFSTMIVVALCTAPLFAQAGGGQVTLVEVKGSVEVRKGAAGNPWDPASAGQVLGVQDSISTGLFSSAKIRFANNSEIDVGPLTEMVIAEFRVTPEVVTTEVDLKYGTVGTSVKRGTAANDFKVKTPVSMVGVPGTEVKAIAHYPGYGSMVEMGREGAVDVTVNPTRRIVRREKTDNRLTTPIFYAKTGSWTPLNFSGWTPQEFTSSLWWAPKGPGGWDSLRNSNPSNANLWGQIQGGNTIPFHEEHYIWEP